MQTKRQLKRCTRNVHPSFADFRPGLGVNFHILLTQNWLWESSLSLLSLWCILFQIKLGLFRENLNLKKHLGPKNGWSSPSTFWHRLIYIYEPVTKVCDLKWDTLPQNQTPSKLFSVLPLESGMFQVTISIIKKWFWSKCVLYGIKTGVRSGVDVCNNGHSECHNNTEKNHLYAILMLLVHLSSC